MDYYDAKHKLIIENFNNQWDGLNVIEKLAEKYDINDIAQDNNLKLLQTLVYFGFKNQSGREGSDAIDRYGHEWELKTANINLVTGFSTNHHTNHERIAQFRQERWLFSLYRGIKLEEVYAMSPKTLEVYFSDWTNRVNKKAAAGMDNPHLNNPKIPIKFVRQNGIKVYPINSSNPIDPAELLKVI
ncbi:MAG: restriction endonuclease [Lachnospiraceae bacterium]|uniref:restriction endonuclease n=1 Tax=Mogibacterium sp. TaxID=2049035 RepID=UPI00258543BD|nr:restriction endonuclease [Mogibacterium sp.]MCI5740637.1 restriction endonuclease [Lachnospiraceae bacterium]MCI7123415.1 restriction endonuclease [Mogibacterium sp.]